MTAVLKLQTMKAVKSTTRAPSVLISTLIHPCQL
jgi:hypothetical protein